MSKTSDDSLLASGIGGRIKIADNYINLKVETSFAR